MDRFRLFDFVRTLLAHRPIQTRRRPVTRLLLEHLEDRTVPSAISGVTPNHGPAAGAWW